MGSSSPSGPTSSQLPYLAEDTYSSTWLEKLLLNLFSYSLVLVPIAVLVLATKYRLLPGFLHSSTLVQLFVNGYYYRADGRHQNTAIQHDSESLIIQDSNSTKRPSSTRRTPGSSLQNDDGRRNTLKFLWCFFGLMISYLIWGILQEKIMTTKYIKTDSTATSLLNNDSSKLSNDNSYSSLVTRTHNPDQQHITFHDSQFLVFINRIISFILAIVALIYDRPNRKSSRLLYLANGKYQVQYRNLNLNGQPSDTTSSSSSSSSSSPTKPSAPLYQFVYCSLSNILSSWCQYEALKYVNFPTQVLSKTFKIVPVMIMSKILLHKKYKPIDYSCALVLSLGMFIFLLNQPGAIKHHNHSHNNLLNSSTALNSSPPLTATNNNGHESNLKSESILNMQDNKSSSTLLSGLLLLTLYLGFDSFTGNWQKSLFTRYQVTNWQMMAAVNLYSILLTLTSLYQLGNLTPALKLLASSRPLLVDCLLMSVMSSVGQFFVYYTINQFGPVIFTVIMTFRQLLAILISCALYGHQVTAGSSLGILLVFAVVAFQLWHRSATGKSRATPADATTVSRIKFEPATGS